MEKKVYVILANLGGPSKKGEVRKFLFNLFNDKYIIPLPKIPRFILASLISLFRSGKSQKEYDKMGGCSPILQNTQTQARLLHQSLGGDFEVLIAMSYSRPNMEDAFAKIDNPKKVILLPLYPQYSITTTKSCAAKFCKTATKNNVQNIDVISNFYQNSKYIASCVERIISAFNNIEDKSKKNIILFSAHGIPVDFVEKFNDPYRDQIESTASLIQDSLKNMDIKFEGMVCFQSRVGPKEWLKPYIQDVLPQCKGCNVIIFPVAFVSEHLETLVELDHQYNEFAKQCGVLSYHRALTPSDSPMFIHALTEEVLNKN
ncbi:MAG: ferrochelatase [Candidatus Deianiraeaceae bacterium]|jgi:ferrochelatase